MGKLAVLAVAIAIAFGGIGAALADWRSSDPGAAIELAGDFDARKSEADDDVELVEHDEAKGDGDRTRGNDGTSGGNNTGDGDRTRGNDGTAGGNNTGDRDLTAGNDGTGGGNNTGVSWSAGGGGDTGGGGTGSGGTT